MIACSAGSTPAIEAMDHAAAHNIAAQLEAIKARPAMFIASEDDVELTRAFLDGFRTAAFAPYGSHWTTFHNQAIEKRGWELSARCPSREMREKGLQTKQIVAELIEIEIDAWRLFMTDHQK